MGDIESADLIDARHHLVEALFRSTGQGNASATKDGSHYKITGTATGVDMANPMSPVNKSFEIEVTCS
nr:lipoprotein LpqH [Mycobacterium tuberculosis]